MHYADWLSRLIKILREYISRFKIRPYKNGTGVIRYAHARCHDNKLQLTLVVVTDNFAGRDWLYNKLKSEKVFSNIVFDNLDLVLAEFSINKLVSDYRTRYKRAISILLDNVIEPALNHEDLDPEIKKRVENTKTRLLQKESLEEIVFFYNDALQARSGKTIVEEFRKHKLHAFEDYESEIIRIAKGQ